MTTAIYPSAVRSLGGTTNTHTGSNPLSRNVAIVYDAGLQQHLIPRAGRPVWWQRAAGWRIRSALARTERQQPQAASLWRAKAAGYNHHLQALTPWAATVWLAQQILSLVMPWRQVVSWCLFPSQWLAAPHKWDEHMVGVTPLCIITRDHAVIDAALYAAGDAPPRAGPIVLAPPNGCRGEELKALSAQIAATSDRHVLAFNYRNTGLSVGSVCGTSQAAQDTESALLCAQSMAMGQSIAVVGVSIGAGCAAQALANMHQSGTLAPHEVDTFVAYHAFSSLPATMHGLCPVLPRTVARLALFATGMAPLDTAHRLRERALAQRLVVLQAHDDAVIRPSAELAAPASWGLAGPTARSAHRFKAGQAHCDMDSFWEPKGWVRLLRAPQGASGATPHKSA